jgi:hypothetical protein
MLEIINLKEEKFILVHGFSTWSLGFGFVVKQCIGVGVHGGAKWLTLW